MYPLFTLNFLSVIKQYLAEQCCVTANDLSSDQNDWIKRYTIRI